MKWEPAVNRPKEWVAKVAGGEVHIKQEKRGLKYFRATYRGGGITRDLGGWPTIEGAKAGAEQVLSPAL
jgi:hypothetical protein